MNISEICLGCMQQKGSASQCPHCGRLEGTQAESPLQLRPGTVLLGQYLIGRMLGKIGGFGITYLGFDVKLEVPLAIKEYLPRELVARDTGSMTVVPHSTEDRELFAYGLSQFLQEARTLARFNHPNVVRVRSFFEELGTAFLVMDYYEGMTLSAYVNKQGGRLPEKQAVDIMMPVLDGLREVHEQGFLHRDVKPQNIYLAKGKSGVMPILLDFGAARQAMGEQSRSLSVVLTPGYAPFEQYHRKGKYGPWTDVYGAAATMYYMVTGQAPPEATERVDEDSLVPPSGVSVGFEKAVMAGLALRPEGRPKSVRAFQEILLRGAAGSAEKRGINHASGIGIDESLIQKMLSRNEDGHSYQKMPESEGPKVALRLVEDPVKAQAPEEPPEEPLSQTPANAAPNRRELFKAALDSGLIYAFAERQQGRWGTEDLQKLVAELEAQGFGGITDVEAGWLIDKETARWRRNLQQQKEPGSATAQHKVHQTADAEKNRYNQKKPITIVLVLLSIAILVVLFSFASKKTGITSEAKKEVAVAKPATKPAAHEAPEEDNRFKDLGNGIIKDTVTGLMWEKSQTSDPMSWQGGMDYAKSLRLGGYSNWRLPTKEELEELIEFAKKKGAQRNFHEFYNNLGFEGWVASDYWSSTTYASYTSLAWDVNFYDGGVYYSSKTYDYYVRAVRQVSSEKTAHPSQNEPSAGIESQTKKEAAITESATKPAAHEAPAKDERFKDLGNGVIKDTVTELMWEKSQTSDPMNWQGGMDYAKNLRLGGYSDWRLPTKEELEGLIAYAKKSGVQQDFNKFYNNLGFKGWVASYFWSSTTLAYGTYGAWVVSFYNGYVGSYGKTDYYCVRAIRQVSSQETAHPSQNEPSTVIESQTKKEAAITESATKPAAHKAPAEDERFKDLGNGIIKDTVTGLMWEKSQTSGKMKWHGGMDYAKSLRLGGYSDWRLPTEEELVGLIRFAKTRGVQGDFNKFYNKVGFRGWVESLYWSSTVKDGYASKAWCVSFGSGILYDGNKTDRHYVRVVRSGQ